MESNQFFKKIREIIREEIDYALDKKLNTPPIVKKSQKETIEHGLSLLKQYQDKPKPQQKPKQSKSNFGSIQDILEETRRTLQESTELDGEFSFTSDMASGLGNSKYSAIPQGVDPNEVPSDVMSALTRNYSALVKKMDEKKGR